MFAEDISEDFSEDRRLLYIIFTGFYSISGYLRNLRGRLLSSEKFSSLSLSCRLKINFAGAFLRTFHRPKSFGKSKGGLSKEGLGPKGANWAKKGPFGATSALPPWLWGAEELVPIGPEKAPIGPEKVPICPEKA